MVSFDHRSMPRLVKVTATMSLARFHINSESNGRHFSSFQYVPYPFLTLSCICNLQSISLQIVLIASLFSFHKLSPWHLFPAHSSFSLEEYLQNILTFHCMLGRLGWLLVINYEHCLQQKSYGESAVY
jgi:hypothetical protein